MKLLVTGAKGFIGKNLVSKINELKIHEILSIDKENSKKELFDAVINADFIFHLAGVNRPKNELEFFEGNKGLTDEIIEILKDNNKKTPILITSSVQADLENAYGKSKKAAEDSLLSYGEEANVGVFIYRLPNVFGKWCMPNYNSAIATFCHNIARGYDVVISDKTKEMTLVYIDDVVNSLVDKISDNNASTIRNNIDDEHGSDMNIMKINNHNETSYNNHNNRYFTVDSEYKITLGEIVDKIYSFKNSRENLMIPNMQSEITKKLYSTYLSYLPENEFSYALKMNVDNRGSFTEFIKSENKGQVSINISKPNITKGNHFHNTKNEKFLVVSGNGAIRFRKIGGSEVIEYKVSGEKLEVVDIPVGYTHSIVNEGTSDMVTVMWVNEVFDLQNPDTIFEEV